MDWKTLFCLLLVTLLQAKAQEDPCVDATMKVNEYRRSSNYQAGMDGEETYLCDRYLETGWYIFDGPAGNEMPTVPPGLGKCGTGYPIWLDDALPTEEEGIVERDACAQGLTSNCDVGYTIQIKNCGDNYAYYLVSTAQSCPEAYCIGNQIPCPTGESSENGFTPGCTDEGFPTLYNEPTITYRVDETINPESGVTFREVTMLCNVDHNETEIFLDVVWYMGGVKVAEHVGPNSLPYSDAPAELFEFEWSNKAKLDNNVRCELRARYEQTQIPGPMKSAEYYMGFTVDNLILTVEEGGDPAHYTIRPTIPVLCPVGFEVCQLALEVREPYIDDAPAASCPDGRKLKQTAIEFRQTECIIEVPMVLAPDENTAFSMEVHAASDSTYDGDHEIKLVIRSPEIHQFHPIWADYHLPQAQINVIDKDMDIAGLYCRAYNDPHFITMDGRIYDNQLEGEFILYRHNTLPIEVQAYFKNSGSYSRVCGAAVRSGGDLFIYDTCRDGQEARIRLYECEDLNMAIVKTGSTVDIELPHGTKIKITSTQITIYPTLGDLNSIGGLCGQFDRICGNDFLGADGRQFEDACPNPDCSNVANCARERRHEFAETWRVDPDESLYQGKINSDRPKPDVIYCSCVDTTDDNGTPEHETVCQTGTDLEFCIAGGGGGGGDFEQQCVERFKLMSSGVGSDDVVDEVGPFEYDPNFNPPEPEWKDGWTEALARTECEQFLSAVQGFDTCLTVPNINKDELISACIEDIKITANTEFNVVHANGFLSSCLTEITKNMTFFKFDNDTGAMQPPNDMTKNICSNQCLNSGTCVNQTCQCTPGYFGEDCSFDENKVPALYSIPSGGLCDTRTRPCEQTPVTGHYFLEKDTLSCHIEPTLITVTGEKLPQGETKTKGRFDHFERVMCPLPVVTINYDDDVFTVGYSIAVSNDGVTKSDARNMVTYDSVCMNCSVDMNCVQLEGTCFIDTNCYIRGNSAPEDPCRLCDPDSSSSDWTKATDGNCQSSNTGLIVGCSLLLVGVAVSAVIGSVFLVKKKKKMHSVVI